MATGPEGVTPSAVPNQTGVLNRKSTRRQQHVNLERFDRFAVTTQHGFITHQGLGERMHLLLRLGWVRIKTGRAPLLLLDVVPNGWKKVALGALEFVSVAHTRENG